MFIVFAYMIYIYSGVNYKGGTFLLNILHALLLNVFLWLILQTVWIRSDLCAVSSRFIMFAYVIELFLRKSDESL